MKTYPADKTFSAIVFAVCFAVLVVLWAVAFWMEVGK